ncbi:MAG TPA: ribosome silencing factor [Armatimonadetes bacterium]|nr:ribosome silencing factor [Armatimonadota bacterium]
MVRGANNLSHIGKEVVIVSAWELMLDICRIADDKRGRDIAVLDLSHLLPITDYFVIITCENPIHIQALVEELEQQVKERWGIITLREGEPESRWVILDCGDVIVHLFDEALRRYYDLEGLWGDAIIVKWENELARIGWSGNQLNRDDA